MERPEIDPGQPGFSWLTALDSLIANPVLLREEHAKLSKAAGEWPTCACSQLCKTVQRNDDGSPIDGTLRELGLQFYSSVTWGRLERARELFFKIEKRTSELLEFGSVNNEKK